LLIRLIVVAFATTVVAAQQAVPVANGVILGKVIDVVTKAPVSGVLVQIGAPSSPAPQPPIKALTDDQGRFVFRHLPPGSYAISATTGSNGFEPSGFLVTGLGHLIAPYLNGGFGQRRPNGPLQHITLEQGAVMAEAVISLWKGASIDGMVVDEANEPLVGTVVAAVRRTSDGAMTTGPTTRTDDRGMYHISALAPGDYVVAVPQTQVLMPESASSSPVVANTLAAAGASARHVYVSTFHPAATTFEQARVVSLASGDEVNGVDVQLTPLPASTVSGTLMDGSVPVPHFGVRLLPADTGDGAEVMELASSATDAQGRFTFPLVPTGQYRIVAQRQTAVPNGTTLAETAGAWAEARVTMAERPIDDVVMTLRAGFRVSGKVVFAGVGAPPAKERLGQFRISALLARPQQRQSAPAPVGQVDATGNVTIGALAPGRYILQWPDSIPGWSVESVTVAGRDVADAAFEITDADITDLVVTLTDQPARIGGSVRSMSGLADFDAAVFMFPTDRSRWREAGASTKVVRTVRVDATGAFLIPNTIPGEYYLVAVSDNQAHAWPDQKLLAQLSVVASTVRVGARQQMVVSLSTMEVR